MPDIQPSPTPDPTRATHATTNTVLELLLENDIQRPWSLHELALEIGSTAVVENAIDELHSAGLIHKTSEGFVFAARPAIRYSEINEGPGG